MRECVDEHLEMVGGQICWRRTRRALLREPSDHIADQTAAFEAEGRSPEEALTGAVAEMGELKAVDRELDRLHRPRNRRGLAVTMTALFAADVLLQLFATRLIGDAKDIFYLRRQVLGLLLAVGILAGLWFSNYILLLRRKRVPAAALLLLSLAPLWGLSFGRPFLSYKLVLYPTPFFPVPYAVLMVFLRGYGTRAVLLCDGLALPLSIQTFVAISNTGYLVTLASMPLVPLVAVGLGRFRGERRWNLLAVLGPALTALPLLFLRHLEYAAWHISALLGPDLFYERLRMGGLPSLFVGSSPEFPLAETTQGPGRWVFWAAAGLIIFSTTLLLRRIRTLHNRAGKLLIPSAFLPLLLQATIYQLYSLGWWPLGVLSLPLLSYGVFFLLVDAALMGVLLSVFHMDALLRDTVWVSSTPIPRPSVLDTLLDRGQLHIEYRKRAQRFRTYKGGSR